MQFSGIYNRILGRTGKSKMFFIEFIGFVGGVNVRTVTSKLPSKSRKTGGLIEISRNF